MKDLKGGKTEELRYAFSSWRHASSVLAEERRASQARKEAVRRALQMGSKAEEKAYLMSVMAAWRREASLRGFRMKVEANMEEYLMNSSAEAQLRADERDVSSGGVRRRVRRWHSPGGGGLLYFIIPNGSRPWGGGGGGGGAVLFSFTTAVNTAGQRREE